MRISEEAKRASGLACCYETDKQRLANIIQTAINEHEADLVMAAEKAFASGKLVGVDYDLKAALERRRE